MMTTARSKVSPVRFATGAALVAVFLASCGDSSGSDGGAFESGHYRIRAELPGGNQAWGTVDVTVVSDLDIYVETADPDFESAAYGVTGRPLPQGRPGWGFPFLAYVHTTLPEPHTLQWFIVPSATGYGCTLFYAGTEGPYTCTFTRTGPL